MRIDRLTALLVLGIVITAAVVFWPLMAIFFVAASFAVVLMPVQRYASRRISAWLSAFLITAAVVIALAFTLGVLADLLYRNADGVLLMLRAIIDWVAALLGGLEWSAAADIAADLHVWLNAAVGELRRMLMTLAPQIPVMVMQFIVFMLGLYIALVAGDRVAAEFFSMLPERSRRGARMLAVTVSDTLHSIYVLHVVVAAVTFVLAIPFYTLLGYGDPLFFATVTAIFQLIPALGSLAVIVFLGVYALAVGDMRGLALIGLVGYPLLSAFPDFLLRPYLMGKRQDVHPVLVLIGFIGGIATMGIIGFVLGPLLIALLVSGYRVLIEELRADSGEEEKGVRAEDGEVGTGDGAAADP